MNNMKKMVMVLMMVFGLSAVFAGTFVAFTSEEAFNDYCDSDHTEWDADQKAFFEETTVDLSAKQKKKMTLIVVCDSGKDGVIKNHILVYAYDSKSFGVIIFDDHFDEIVNTGIYTYEKTNPVMVGLSCLKEQVTHIVDLDKMEVTFCTFKSVRNPDQE